jgi:hypothetical protein
VRAAGLLANLRAEWGDACVMADGKDHRGPLEFAHLPGKPTSLLGRGRGSRERYYDIRRHPGAYVLVCRRHHSRLDSRGGRGSQEYGRTKEAA